MTCFELSDYPSCAQGAANGTVSHSHHTHCKNRMAITCSNQHTPSHMHRVQCSEGHPTPMGIAGRVRPCRRAEAATARPMESGGPQRNGTI